MFVVVLGKLSKLRVAHSVAQILGISHNLNVNPNTSRFVAHCVAHCSTINLNVITNIMISNVD